MQKILSASLLALAIIAPAAQAYEAGDIIVRAGAANVNPQENSDFVSVGGAPTALKASLDSDTQLGLTATYMLSSNFGVELLAATPFQHTIGLRVGNVEVMDFADVNHLPPTLSLQYFPLGSGSKFQPYVGLGLNYTTFFGEDLSGTATAAGFHGLELDDSYGLALQVGADYMLTDNIVLNAAVWKIDIETTATAYAGAAKVEVDVEVDPYAYMVGVGYKF